MTNNFKKEEFLKSQKALENNIDNSLPLELERNLYHSALKMQSIRDFVLRSIVVTSGYRCEQLNKIVNGAENSDHRKALGVDFYVNGYTIEDHQTLAKILQKREDVRYVKVYTDNRIHISWKII